MLPLGIRAVAAALATLAVASPAVAAEFYVAIDGSDSNPGTLEKPFATVERGQMAAAAGDTVFIRGGVYRFSGTQATIGVSFTKSGQKDKPIRYFAYAGEAPIFDLFELKPQARVTGLDVRANWIHLRGLEVRGVRQLIVGDSWGVRIRGDHNVIEQLNVHDCEAPGVFITSGAGNLVLNTDSHHNYDPLEDGGNADGFGCHSTGGDNVLRGCRAYENSDDGFDFINAPGICTVERSWSFRNGYIPNTNMAGANGAGFKSGGFGEPPNIPASGVPRHVIRNNLAFGNRAIGFYANHHPGGIDFYNNTAFDNPSNFDMRPATGMTTSHELRNNLAAGSGRAIVNFNGGSDEINSWTLDVKVMADDFASMDKTLALMPRQADGSLPNVPLMLLVAGSDLLDRGEDVGLPFAGKAPDLGAFELGANRPAGPADAGAADAASPSIDAGSAPAAGRGGSTAQPPAAEAGKAATPSERAGASAPPAGAPAPPAGAPADSGAADPSDSPQKREGCGIAHAGAPPRAWVLSIAAVGFALLRRRRRKPTSTRLTPPPPRAAT